LKPKEKTAEKFIPENTEKGHGATRQVYLVEVNLEISVNDLLILFRLAKNGEMARAKISYETGISLTGTKNHLKSLQNDHFVQETKREQYRNVGVEIFYRVAIKGLIVAIILAASPNYDSLNLREKAPTWKKPEVTRKAYYQTVEVGAHLLVLPSYDPNKERIEVPGLADKYYSNDVPDIIENNPRLFPINYEELTQNQKNIAIKSAIYAAYKTGENGLPCIAPKGFIKASRRFPYLKKHLEQRKDEPFNWGYLQNLFLFFFLSLF
jgi:predicted transcriptional regulator